MLTEKLLTTARSHGEAITTLRRAIHAEPELGLETPKTLAKVRAALADLPLEWHEGPSSTGAVAVLKGAKPGSSVLLRGDMDALPMSELTGLDFASTIPGRMHACGHDAHTAMLLGAARHLKNLADAGELNGTVRLLFQPAEEKQDDDGRSGGQRFVEEGALDGLDVVFAQHISPGIEAGKLSTMIGPITAASDSVEFTIQGSAGHAATPHLACDAIAIAGPIISALHQIVSRNINPLESAVITFGSIHGGTQANVIADRVVLEGTIRCFLPEVRQRLHHQVQAVTAIAAAMGGEAKARIVKGYPMTINDTAVTQRVMETIRSTFGTATFEEFPVPSTGSEDFGFMAAKVPGCMMRVGVRNPKWASPRHAHTPGFSIDERALPYGAANFVAQVLSYTQNA